MDTVGAGLSSIVRVVVPILEVMPCILQSVGGKQFTRSTETVCFPECPLSEVPPYIVKYLHFISNNNTMS